MSDIKKVLSPHSSIDSAIREMLPNFNSESQGRMQKAILNAKKSAEKHRDENTDAAARHVFREFIPASILNQKGFAFEYENLIGGKKPDWLDYNAKIMMESYTYERGGSSSFSDRLNSAVTEKCTKYKKIVDANSLRFVVSVYIDFLTGLSIQDDCIEEIESFRPIFDSNNSLWAIIFFVEAQKVDTVQWYDFFCLCADSSFETIPNWPFYTLNLNNLGLHGKKF